MPKQDSEKLITREEFEKVKKLLEARATKLDKRLEELQENFRKGIKISGEEYKNVLSAIRKLEQEFEVFKIDFVKFYDEFGSIVGRIKRVEHNTGVTSQNTNQLIAHVVNLDERQDKMEADISQIKKELKQIRDELSDFKKNIIPMFAVLFRETIMPVMEEMIVRTVNNVFDEKLDPAIGKALDRKLGPAIDAALDKKLGPAINNVLDERESSKK